MGATRSTPSAARPTPLLKSEHLIALGRRILHFGQSVEKCGSVGPYRCQEILQELFLVQLSHGVPRQIIHKSPSLRGLICSQALPAEGRELLLSKLRVRGPEQWQMKVGMVMFIVVLNGLK